MRLFKRPSNPEEKWHKKALFVNLSRTRIVLVVTTEPKPECAPSWIPAKEPHSVIEEFLEQEQCGLLGFFSCL